MARVRAEIDRAIEMGEDARDAALLEELSVQSQLSPYETIAFGLILMMPPLADYVMAANVFSRCLQTTERFRAAIWGQYVHVVLRPVSEEFAEVLAQYERNATAKYMLARSTQAVCDVETRRVLITESV